MIRTSLALYEAAVWLHHMVCIVCIYCIICCATGTENFGIICIICKRWQRIIRLSLGQGGWGGQAQISGSKIKYIGCKKSYQPPNAVEQQHFWSPYTALGTLIILLP